MSTPSNLYNTLHDEYKKLDELIKIATSKELSIPEIVNTYYQIINVSSLLVMLKQQVGDDTLQEKITCTEQKVSEFNSKIHPKILSHLTITIEDARKKLRVNSHKQLQTDIEKMAHMYEDLRQKMSTREFVEQYGAKLTDD